MHTILLRGKRLIVALILLHDESRFLLPLPRLLDSVFPLLTTDRAAPDTIISSRSTSGARSLFTTTALYTVRLIIIFGLKGCHSQSSNRAPEITETCKNGLKTSKNHANWIQIHAHFLHIILLFCLKVKDGI